MSGSPIALDSWLLESVIHHVDPVKQYTSNLIAREIVDSLTSLHLVKIVRWILKSSNDMNAIVCDGSHHMFVTVPFQPAIVAFELRYQQRITYETVNTHMIVRKARLRFARAQELVKGFRSKSVAGMAMVIMEIAELEFFLRDKFESVGSDKPFIYETSAYVNVCGRSINSVDDSDDENDDLMLMMNS